MSALPVSATAEVYYGEVETLDDGTKIVPLMVKNVENLGSCDINFEFSDGVTVTDVTSGDGNALTVQTKDIDNTENIVQIIAWDIESHDGDQVLCNIAYEGSDSNPFENTIVELYDYDSYDKILHTGNNYIERSSGTSTNDDSTATSITTNPTETNTADDSATSIETVSGEDADGEIAVDESTETVDETNGPSGEDNNGIPGFGLLTGLSVMLIARRLFREDK